ncbi:MAG: uridine diphosphate-N-acetylglucosamine-binding protein YvcK [Caldilinea sp.]
MPDRFVKFFLLLSEYGLFLLRPGSGVKRHLLPVLAGFCLASLGFALLLLLWLAPGPQKFSALFSVTWGLLLIGAGTASALFGIFRLYGWIGRSIWPEEPALHNRRALRSWLHRQQRRHGPRIVAIGGGTGMPQLLRGLRAHTDNLTAIVTVADDGGSSGRLRRQTGTLPPGDFRNNIAALSEVEGLMTRLFQYRFAESDVGEEQPNGLAGHSFGNLFITTMAAITGSFESGIAESSRVLAVRGRVLPSTLENVTLFAEVKRLLADGHVEWGVVQGESNMSLAGGQIERVYLQPAHARAYPEAIRAILQADLIVAGPGSFYTSVLPNLLVDAIRDAILASAAVRIYVCNVATQAGETDGYTVLDHLLKLRQHAGEAFTAALANHNYDLTRSPGGQASWVTLPAAGEAAGFQIFTGDIVDSARPWRHDSQKLAASLLEVYRKLAARSPKV